MDVLLVAHAEFGQVLSSKKLVFTKANRSGVTAGINNLLRVADRYGAKVTIAVCPEVAEYVELPSHAEIGVHIHPGWQEFAVDGVKYYAGDSFLRKNTRQSTTETVLPAFSYEEQFEMIQVGTERIAEVFKSRPTTFLAGRWSVNNDTIRAAIKTGLKRDCSAMAGHKDTHFDWSKLPRICPPYSPSCCDYQEIGNLPFTIIPISQMWRGGSVNIETPRIYGPLLKWTFSEYYRKNIGVFHICLHSPCMTDDYYVNRLDKLLFFISRHRGVNFKYASEITEA